MPIAIIVICFMTLVAGVYWYRTNSLSWRLRKLRQATDKLAKKRLPNKKAVAVMFRQIYALIHQGMRTQQPAVIYQAADALKLAVGVGLGRSDEPLRLMTLIVLAIKTKQPDVAGQLLDVFRTLVKRCEPQALPAVINPLLMVATTAMKEKQNFLAAKVADLVFSVLDRPDCLSNQAVMNAAFRAVRFLGILAIRRHDEALFREIANRLTAWSSVGKELNLGTEAAQCLVSWMHRIMKGDNCLQLQVLDELTQSLVDNRLIRCLNPNSTLGPRILTRILFIAVHTEDAIFFRRMVRKIVQVVAMVLTRYTFAEAFPVVFPLADTGRRLLQAELNFAQSTGEGFRPQALHILVRELLVAFEMLARQRMTVTAGELIVEFLQLWQEHPAASGQYGKAARKFCQLLLSFWAQTSRRKSRRLELVGDAQQQLSGFSQLDKAKLSFMLD
ncbi:MAG: hypothetical protein K0Q75_1117 [Anaerospora sp.]|nr:hypothetical protein [Anaerospora sp.]